ncbi:MAG: M20 family peptidase [Chloroflexi bacterium]|nr:MAG: M20 family peptidase [Chloroflexota bacterium]
MSELLQYFQENRQNMVDQLIELIGYESFTADKAMVDKLGAYMQRQFEELQASSITRYALDEAGDMLLAKWHEDAPGKPIMFLIHIDTVWPIGTLAERPVRIDEDGRLFGPGAVDMKGGITIVLWALRGLLALQQMPNRPIWVLMTTDEEIGSKHSEALIKELGAQAGLVLVMEPGTREGAIKTWRKGVAMYTIDIEGRASHAGNAPEQGINSIIEFARQALKIHELNDLRNGTSVSVTMVNGGTARNVIPAHTSGFIDVRTMLQTESERIQRELSNLEPLTPGAKVVVKCEHQRPPMEHNDQMKRTVAQAKRIGEAVGVTVREDGSGGGSDGNFTAGMGIPTLDGLGPQGDGLHALHEHVVINSLPTRAALIAGILRDWVFED